MDKWETIYRAHVNTVYRYTLSRVRRHDVAEDVTSDVFLALRFNLESVDADQLPNWLLTVARHRLHDHQRREAVRRRYLSQQVPGASTVMPDTDGALALRGIAKLKPLHLACLRLRYGHGLRRAEIAKRLALDENQVKSALQYALRLLRHAAGQPRRPGDDTESCRGS